MQITQMEDDYEETQRKSYIKKNYDEAKKDKTNSF